MKQSITLLFAVVLAFGISSCEKCADCSCTGSYTFDFDEGIPAEDQTSIENAYIAEFTKDDSQEICAKKKDLESDTAAYVTKSDSSFTTTNKYGSLNYTVQFDYDCACVEKK